MKNWLPMLLATAAFTTTGVVAADENNNGYENGNCETECCSEDNGFHFWADALIMQPCRNMNFANTTVTATTAITSHYGEWDWDFGFRVGAGFQVPCHQWSVNAEFTWFSSDWDSTLNVAATSTANPFVANSFPFLLGTLTNGTVTTKMEMDYYTFDVVGAYSCCMCEALELTPYGGFRALWVDTDVTERLSAATIWTGATDGADYSSDYAGFGLTGGLRWKFYTCYPLHVIGHFGASTLLGAHDTSITVRQTGAAAGTLKADEDCRANLGLEGSFGFVWQGCAWGFPLDISARYEAISWNNLRDPFVNGQSTFALHGLSVRAGLNF